MLLLANSPHSINLRIAHPLFANLSHAETLLQNNEHNFLYNYLSLGEDDPQGKNRVIMEPDCADNPFYMRAYFAWKLGLPFGYHVCDRGSLERSPRTGQWITNEMSDSKTDPVEAINIFLRRIKDGVQSATARTALADENSDYYPVPIDQGALLPGIVYADPYGILLSWWDAYLKQMVIRDYFLR